MSAEKSIPMTMKRRTELRGKGQVARSVDIGTVTVLAVGLLMLLVLTPGLGRHLMDFMGVCFREAGQTSAHQKTWRGWGMGVPIPLLVDMGLFFLAVISAVLVSQFSQVGFQMSDRISEPNWERLNPVNGLKQLFSVSRLVTLGQSLLKIMVIAGFSIWGIRELLMAPVFSHSVGVMELLDFLKESAWVVGWRCIAGLGVIATLDYVFQRWKFEHDHRMSPQELKDEFRQTEGATELKMKRRQAARKISLRRMMENMADATIVVTNPTHYAVALRYQRGVTRAPITVAKGMRRIAQRIKDQALTYHVPMIENRPLAQGLYKHARVGEAIPVLYYEAVASILAQLYRRGLQTPTQEEAP
jgi:flagellar biosynthetic protein FlhB